jgi:tetratricopeptide (TPR) repeat protein
LTVKENVALFKNNIGDVYLRLLKRPQEAIKYFEEAIKAVKEAQGEGSLDEAGYLKNLGEAYLQLNRKPEAVVHYEGAFRIRKDELGPEHEITLEISQILHDLRRERNKIAKM